MFIIIIAVRSYNRFYGNCTWKKAREIDFRICRWNISVCLPEFQSLLHNVRLISVENMF